jgi:hypothetical protein
MPVVAPKLRNIGPKSAAWLRQVGLRTEADLVAVGPVEAYMRVRAAAPQTPLSSGMRTQAGRPWNGPTTSSLPS